jgi:hypothetical protein
MSQEPVTHPVVREHHVTGRRCLYPGSYFGSIATAPPSTGAADAGADTGTSAGVDDAGGSAWKACQQWKQVADWMDWVTYGVLIILAICSASYM